MTRLKFWLPLGGFLLLCVLFAVALYRAPDKEFVKSALIGKPMPAFTMPDLLNPGGTVDSADFGGRWLLVNVWFSTCPPCRIEHPVLLDIAKTGKVTIVGLNYREEDDEDARRWLAELGNPYAAVGSDREGRVAIDFGVYGAPETFLIDPQGIIVDKVVSVVTPKLWRDRWLPLIEGKGP